MSMTTMNTEEIAILETLVQKYLDPSVFHLGTEKRKAVKYDKRVEMYGGEGIVYLMQLFHPKELVSNRIGAYMILPTNADSCGFHTHGSRKEQELYVVIHGEGIYREKADGQSEPRNYQLTKGNVTSIKGKALHSISNTGKEPLIIFVVTTNEV